MSTQVGEFTVGAVGVLLRIQLQASASDTFDISDAEDITLKITRPDGSEFTRILTTPDGVVDAPNRIIQYTIQAGDLTIGGAYGFVITLGFAGDKAIVQSGSFTVGGLPASPSILVKEDGSIVDGANSYADIDDGDLYHARHLYPEAWTAATADRKERALMMATSVIDAYWLFAGNRFSATQALAWPRAYVPNNERMARAIYDGNLLAGLAGFGTGYYTELYPSDAVPVRVVAATCEMARLLLEGNRTAEDSTKGISSLSIGSGALSFSFNPQDRKAVFTPTVNALLAPFGQSGSGSGFKPVVRT